MANCYDSCDNGEINYVFKIYCLLMSAGSTDGEAWGGAQLAGNYYSVGCYAGCGF